MPRAPCTYLQYELLITQRSRCLTYDVHAGSRQPCLLACWALSRSDRHAVLALLLCAGLIALFCACGGRSATICVSWCLTCAVLMRAGEAGRARTNMSNLLLVRYVSIKNPRKTTFAKKRTNRENNRTKIETEYKKTGRKREMERKSEKTKNIKYEMIQEGKSGRRLLETDWKWLVGREKGGERRLSGGSSERPEKHRESPLKKKDSCQKVYSITIVSYSNRRRLSLTPCACCCTYVCTYACYKLYSYLFLHLCLLLYLCLYLCMLQIVLVSFLALVLCRGARWRLLRSGWWPCVQPWESFRT